MDCHCMMLIIFVCERHLIWCLTLYLSAVLLFRVLFWSTSSLPVWNFLQCCSFSYATGVDLNDCIWKYCYSCGCLTGVRMVSSFLGLHMWSLFVIHFLFPFMCHLAISTVVSFILFCVLHVPLSCLQYRSTEVEMNILEQTVNLKHILSF